jgi:hypothetical protein
VQNGNPATVGLVRQQKHQMTSTCLRPARRDVAQAGPIANKFQDLKFQTKGKRFGHLRLKFEIYLGFVI